MPEVEVTSGTSARALRILDALIKALETRGYPVSPGDGFKKRTCVEVSGQKISFALKEKLRQRPHVLTDEEEAQEARAGWSYAPKYDYSPTGALRIQLGGLERTGARHSWSDGKRALLEEKIGEIVVGFEEAARALVERERAWAEQRQRWEEERRRLEEERRRQEEERQRVKELEVAAREWEGADRIRRFVRAVEHAAGDARTGPELQRWIEWASDTADRMDPIRSFTVRRSQVVGDQEG